MRKYNNLLLLVFIFLVNCNYKPILSSTETSFSIGKIEFLNANKINSKLEELLYDIHLIKENLEKDDENFSNDSN